MPLPLVPVAIGGGVLIVSIAAPAVAREVRKRFGNARVAILGRQEVGKSTLLHFLMEGSFPDQPTRTQDPLPGGRFSLPLPGRSTRRYSVEADLPGHTFPAYKDWRESFESSDFVWYLFRSDLVAAGDADEIALIDEHMAHLADWHSELRGKAPQVILVGVFADQDPSRDDAMLEERVRTSTLIRDGAVNLGKADIVVGSQATEGDAARLVGRIASHLR